jgi:hypothetical protein
MVTEGRASEGRATEQGRLGLSVAMQGVVSQDLTKQIDCVGSFQPFSGSGFRCPVGVCIRNAEVCLSLLRK